MPKSDLIIKYNVEVRTDSLRAQFHFFLPNGLLRAVQSDPMGLMKWEEA